MEKIKFIRAIQKIQSIMDPEEHSIVTKARELQNQEEMFNHFRQDPRIKWFSVSPFSIAITFITESELQLHAVMDTIHYTDSEKNTYFSLMDN